MSSGKSNNSVLIIDDSNIDVMLSTFVIKSNLFSEHVVGCLSAEEGLKYLDSLSGLPEKLPNVILLDINMPMMNGFDFLDSYLEFPEHMQNRCSVFMISATNFNHELERVKTYPVVCKLYSKPLTVDILADIQKTIDGRKS